MQTPGFGLWGHYGETGETPQALKSPQLTATVTWGVQWRTESQAGSWRVKNSPPGAGKQAFVINA